MSSSDWAAVHRAGRPPPTASEADRALKIARDDWIRRNENYDRALKDPSQFSPLLLSEINGCAIEEDRLCCFMLSLTTGAVSCLGPNVQA